MVCLTTPQDCGKLNKPCCYNPDASSAQRCYDGLSCVVQSTSFGSYGMYAALKANASLVASTQLMGVCRKLTKADCGKLYGPCGAAAKALKCSGRELACGKGAFCASPGDTRLGEARCLPLPAGCGKLDGPCCPANSRNDGRAVEVSLGDNKTAVPYCTDANSMCVWQHVDYAEHGTASFPASDPSSPPVAFPWDGYFARGYGRSRCAPAPPKGRCGGPGEVCCPSMMDQAISGLVHNRLYEFQPCNYRAVGRTGIYCKGAWQGELLKKGTKLGVCTPNPTACGKAEKGACCISDIPNIGQVGQCMSHQPPGTYYCTEGANLCVKCPAKLTNATAAFVRRSCAGFF